MIAYERRKRKRRRRIFALGALATLIFLLWNRREPAPPPDPRPPPLNPPAFATPACRESYLRLFAREVVKIRVVFGYKDARPARFVGDRYERAAFLAALQRPCEANRGDCEFHRSADDADLLEKTVRGPNGEPHRVQVEVISSAAGPDDQENGKDPFQGWKTAFARRAFFGGFAEVDALFYYGHSRGGGGPDFGPPKLDAHDRVNFAWYRENREGQKELASAIELSRALPKLMGLYSCVSGDLLPELPNSGATAWVTFDKLIYFADALEAMQRTLSASLLLQCPESLKEELRNANPHSRLTGFF